MAVLYRIFGASVAIAWLGAAGLIIAGSMSGRLLSVQSDSMEPTIYKGDAVMVLRTDKAPDGAIVSYRAPQGTITHRVVAQGVDGTVFTKGDALDSIDPPVAAAQRLGTVGFIMPGLGTLLDTLRSPVGLMLCIYLPGLLLMLGEIRHLYLAYHRPTYRVQRA